MMKVVAINGSPRKDGNTATVLTMMEERLSRQGIKMETLHIGGQQIHGCIACGHCYKDPENRCVFKDDIVNEAAQKMREADGFILGSPTYYAGISGSMKCFLDRVFYTSSGYFSYKVATAFAVVRRTGGLDAVHQLHNYLSLGRTVLPPSQYWTVIYGAGKGEVLQDQEGMQTMRRNTDSMIWLLKSLEAAKGTVPLPVDEEPRAMMNFIRK